MPDYEPLSSIQDPADGEDLLSAWGDQIDENFESIVARREFFHAVVTQAVGSDVESAINFTTEYSDAFGMRDNVTDPTHITLPTSGLWVFTAHAEFDDNTDGRRKVGFQLNGNAGFLPDVESGPNNSTGGAGQARIMNVTPTREYVAGDYIEVFVYQNSGSILNTIVTVSAHRVDN
jgi:hypothetical protein